MVPFSRLLSALKAIPDPRRAQGKRYPLDYLLLFTVLALLSGARSYRSGRPVARATLGSGGFSMDFSLVLSPAPLAHVSTGPPSIPDSRISRIRF